MIEALQSAEGAMWEVRQILARQLDLAAAALRQRPFSDDAIHAIRKQLKRTRATLRLLREPFGAAYRRDNRALRDAARPLTRMRDAKVLMGTLDRLLDAAKLSKSTIAARHLRTLLIEERRHARRRLTMDQLISAADAVRMVARHARNIDDARLGRADLDRAIRRAYKKARNGWRSARAESDDERLHEWRKQVKYLCNQLEVVQPIKRKAIRALAKKSLELADRLGHDHDLAVLHQRLEPQMDASSGTPLCASYQSLVEQLQRRRAKLQQESYRLGKRLYSKRPRRVARTLA